MNITRRQLLIGLTASFVVPGWLKRVLAWFQPEPVRVMVPTFEICSMPMISIHEIRERRFKVAV